MADILTVPQAAAAATERDDPDQVLTEAQLRDLERNNMLRALRMTGWRVSGPDGAAKLLGLRPSTFADRMRKFGISRPNGTEDRSGSAA